MSRTDKHRPPEHWVEVHWHNGRECDLVPLEQFLAERRSGKRKSWWSWPGCGWQPHWDKTKWGRFRHNGKIVRMDSRIRRAREKRELRRRLRDGD